MWLVPATCAQVLTSSYTAYRNIIVLVNQIEDLSNLIYKNEFSVNSTIKKLAIKVLITKYKSSLWYRNFGV